MALMTLQPLAAVQRVVRSLPRVRLTRRTSQVAGLLVLLVMFATVRHAFSSGTRHALHLVPYPDHFDHGVVPTAVPGGGSEATVAQLCATYFNYMVEFGDVNVDPQMGRKYDTILHDRKQYVESMVDRYKPRFGFRYKNEEGNKVVGEIQQRGQLALRKIFRGEFDAIQVNFQAVDKETLDRIQRLRRFGQCYLQDNKLDGLPLCAEVEKLVFPYLQRVVPKYTRWDGTVLEDGHVPILVQEANPSKENPQQLKSVKVDTASCFVRLFKEVLNGRGIALTMGNGHLSEVEGLIKVLRVLGNTLPIQIVHSGELARLAQEALVEWARKDTFDMPPLLADYEREMGTKNNGKTTYMLPKQELWFVDVQPSLTPGQVYNHLFSKFGRKVLAHLFNSFQETVLVDTDTVPLVDPVRFFNHTVYRNTHALFFKDRQVHQPVNGHTLALLKNKVFGTMMDEDHAKFGLPKVTEYTMSNGMFEHGEGHVMESGLVLMDRRQHFAGMLMTAQLQQLYALLSLSWGEKEFFWLGLLMVGDEQYGFNKFRAAAIGQIANDVVYEDVVEEHMASPGEVERERLAAEKEAEQAAKDNADETDSGEGGDQAKEKAAGDTPVAPKVRQQSNQESKDRAVQREPEIPADGPAPEAAPAPKDAAVAQAEPAVVEKRGAEPPPAVEKPKKLKYRRHKVCSAHPGHIDSDDGQTLLWINGGFKHCKKLGWTRDTKAKDYAGMLREEIRKLYVEPFRMEAALVPPLTLELLASLEDRLVRENLHQFNAKPETVLLNMKDQKDMPQPWQINREICGGYMWCAYDRVDDVYGQMVEFSREERARFRFLGDVWFTQGTFSNYELKEV